MSINRIQSAQSFIEPRVGIRKAQRVPFTRYYAEGKIQFGPTEITRQIINNRITLNDINQVTIGDTGQVVEPNLFVDGAESTMYDLYVKVRVSDKSRALAASINISYDSVIDAGLGQGFAQKIHRMGILGSVAGEGIINAANIVIEDLPADENGVLELSLQDPDALSESLMSGLRNIVNTSFTNLVPRVIACPTEVYTFLMTTYIKSSSQLQAAGTISILTKLQLSFPNLELVADDLCKGQGINGADALCILAPEEQSPEYDMPVVYDTNGMELALNTNNWAITQYGSSQALQTRVVPVTGFADVREAKLSISPGWVLKPEAVFIYSYTFK